jgi:hypothetical protein
VFKINKKKTKVERYCMPVIQQEAQNQSQQNPILEELAKINSQISDLQEIQNKQSLTATMDFNAEQKTGKQQDNIIYDPNDVELFISSILFPQEFTFQKTYSVYDGRLEALFSSLDENKFYLITTKIKSDFINKYDPNKTNLLNQELERELLLWEMAQSLVSLSIDSRLVYVRKELGPDELIHPMWLASQIFKTKNRCNLLLDLYKKFKELENQLYSHILEGSGFFISAQ